MATITFSRGFSFQDEPLWTGVLSLQTGTSFTISDGTHSLAFTGTFTYSAGNPAGTVQSIIYNDGLGLVYTLTGLGKNVASVAQAALTTGITDSVYASLLSGNDTLIGSADADVLAGYAGNDTYVIGAGDSIIEAANAGIDLVQTTVNYRLEDNLENLQLMGTGGLEGKGNNLNNTITGNIGNDKLDGVGGVDTLIGGEGDDQYVVDLTSTNRLEDKIIEKAGEGNDTLTLASAFVNSLVTTLVLDANLENIDARDTGTLSLNLTGNASDNLLRGNAGNNVLNGGLGADILRGEDGDDTYIVDNAGDDVIENTNEGNDTVNVAIATAGGVYELTNNVENARLTNKVAFDLTGNDDDNLLIGNAAANRIDGGLGADTLQGGGGNDTYVVDDIGDRVSDTAGNDTVESSVSFTLGSGLENLVLTGTDAISGTGNAAANVLDGSQNTAANVLTGLGGNDTYIVDGNDSVVEALNGGTDTVLSAFSHTLSANVENLTLTGADDIDGTGNSLKNIIIGNSGNNALDGGDGIDTLQGGAGNDDYLVELSATNTLVDKIVEKAGEGFDFVTLRGGNSSLAKASTITLGANLESLDASLTTGVKLNLTGNALDNDLTGNDTDNLINGGAGADLMSGLAGNDTYVVDNDNDFVLENLNDGIDTVNVAIATAGGLYALGDNIEQAKLINKVAFDLTGNDDDNLLIGNAAANRIDGGLGADIMQGGGGNDTYVVDDIGDQVSDTTGFDTVESSVSFTLGTGLDKLVLTGLEVIDGTGNAGANTLDGSQNGANNVLTGLAGNDLYIVGDADTVVEALNGGTDTVQASISFALSANVENLTLTGTDNIDGTGNELANIIIGNSGDNVLTGGAGVDTLRGGLGNDTYVVDLTSTNKLQDKITEALNAGTDTLRLSGGNSAAKLTTITLAANLENLDASLTGSVLLNLTGNTAANLITGNDANNVLNGGAGDDTLFGGLGNDTLIGGTGNDQMHGGLGDDSYTVDSLADTVVEDLNAGTDLVNVAITTAGGTYTLADNVENATLSNKVAFNLTGNDLDNVLTGNAAANVLDGGAGADTMRGGAGNDTYIVDDVGDVIEDTSGIDTVISSISFSLDGTNLENLTLSGTGDISAEGNDLANHLIGNSGNNYLDGFGGVDVLEGKGGDDVYFVDLTTSNTLQDTVIEQANEGFDGIAVFGGRAGLAATTLTLGANIEVLDVSQTEANVKLNLVGNALDNLLIGNTSQNTFTGGLGSDTFAFDTLAQVANAGGASDTITDFVSGVDKFDLRGIGNFTLVDSAATLGANQVQLVDGVLQGSVDGAGTNFQINLTGVTSLVQTDFLA